MESGWVLTRTSRGGLPVPFRRHGLSNAVTSGFAKTWLPNRRLVFWLSRQPQRLPRPHEFTSTKGSKPLANAGTCRTTWYDLVNCRFGDVVLYLRWINEAKAPDDKGQRGRAQKHQHLGQMRSVCMRRRRYMDPRTRIAADSPGGAPVNPRKRSRTQSTYDPPCGGILAGRGERNSASIPPHEQEPSSRKSQIGLHREER